MSRSPLFPLLGLLWLLPVSVAAEEWELRTEEDGIRVSTRPVPGSGIAAFRGEARVEAPVEAVLEVLMDADRHPEWFPDCPTARVLSPDFLDYLHLVKTAEGWRIANIIFHPRGQ